MTRTRWGAGLLALAVGAAALGCSAANAPAGGAAEEGARLEAVIDSVRDALNEAQSNNVPGFPPLTSVKVKLQTTASRSVGGEVRLLVFSLGTRYSSDEASTVELEMVPPKTRESQSLLTGLGVKEALAQAINLAKVGVLRASQGPPLLVMKKISIDLKFAVEVQGSAGASVTLVPLGIGATGRISRAKVHTVSLGFGS